MPAIAGLHRPLPLLGYTQCLGQIQLKLEGLSEVAAYLTVLAIDIVAVVEKALAVSGGIFKGYLFSIKLGPAAYLPSPGPLPSAAILRWK